VAIAQLNIAKANYDLQETISRVTMDVRIAFNELLLNRAKVRVHEDSVGVFDQELKGEQENFKRRDCRQIECAASRGGTRERAAGIILARRRI